MGSNLADQMRQLLADIRAATAIEYALIAALVVGAAMGGLIAMGVSLDLLFSSVSSEVAANTPPPPPPRCVVVDSACPK